MSLPLLFTLRVLIYGSLLLAALLAFLAHQTLVLVALLPIGCLVIYLVEYYLLSHGAEENKN